MSKLPADVRWIGRRLLDPDAAEAILGDLDEIGERRFGSRGAFWQAWVRLELARSLCAVLWDRLGGRLSADRRAEGRASSEGVAARRVPTSGSWAADLVQDMRHTMTAWRRSPGFTLAVALTLALGLGGTTSIFAALHAVYGAALPFEEGERLLRLRSYAVAAGGAERVYNMPDRDALLIRDEARTLSGVVLMRGYEMVLTGGTASERVRGARVSDGWTEVLGVAPVLGRGFTGDESAAGPAAGVALISHALWERRLGADSAAVGATLTLDEGTLQVVGVMPPRFRYPYDAEVWTPMRPDPNNFSLHDLNVVARLADGADEAAVRTELERLYAALAAESPGTVVDDGVHVASLRADFIREDGRTVQALIVAVAFLLLLACVNTANLLTARFQSRTRELALRAALGAGRGRQLRQLLTETVLLFLMGGALGLLVASWLGGVLESLVPDVLREQLGVGGGGFRPAVVVFAAALALVAGLAFGLAAAVRVGRDDLKSMLHEGGRAASGRTGRFQDALVVAELALSLVLLVGAGVMFDHFRRLRGADLGYDLESLYTFRVSLQQDRYADAEARGELVRRLEERLASEPDVIAAGVTSVNPLCCGDWGAPLQVEGIERAPDAPPLIVHHRYATPAYFETLGIDLRQGSPFAESDGPDSAPAVIVDEALARRFWPGESAVGRRVRLEREGEPWRTVVGVVEDVYEEGDYTETWYLPFYQEPLGRSNEDVHVMIRVRNERAVEAARRAVLELDPNLPPYEVASMRSLQDELVAQDRLGSHVSIGFAVFGLILATFGLYGLLSYLVGSRSREIGTRMALGSSRAQVLWLVLRRAAGLLALGTAVGLAAAWGLNVTLSRIVLGVELAGPVLVTALVALLALVAGVASLVPALRASRLDPVSVLQGE